MLGRVGAGWGRELGVGEKQQNSATSGQERAFAGQQFGRKLIDLTLECQQKLTTEGDLLQTLLGCSTA